MQAQTSYAEYEIISYIQIKIEKFLEKQNWEFFNCFEHIMENEAFAPNVYVPFLPCAATAGHGLYRPGCPPWSQT